VGSAYVYTTTGRRKRKVVYGDSFDKVRIELDNLKGNSANGVFVADHSTTVAEYLDYWLREVVSPKRATTGRGYESAVRLHIVPVLGNKRLDKLTGADVRHLIAVCRQKCSCCVNRYARYRPPEQQCCSAGKCCRRTPSTRQIQYIHAVLRDALSNAERDEIITRNVAKLVQIPAPRYEIGKGLPVSDVKCILAEAQRTRLYALYVLAATLGFRRGELLGLRWSDLHLDLGTVASTKTVQRVSGRLLMDDTKTEDSDNTIPLPKITRRVLIEYRNRQAAERPMPGSCGPTMISFSSLLSERLSSHGTLTGSLMGFVLVLDTHRCGYTISATPWSDCSFNSRHHRTLSTGSPGTPTSMPCARRSTASSGGTCEQSLLHGCYIQPDNRS
jgi:integrase